MRRVIVRTVGSTAGRGCTGWNYRSVSDQTLHEHTTPRTIYLRDQASPPPAPRRISNSWPSADVRVARAYVGCLLEVEDADHAIFDSCSGAIAHELSTMTWAEILDGEIATDRATSACRKRWISLWAGSGFVEEVCRT